MSLPWFLRSMIQNLAAARVRQAVMEAARKEVQAVASPDQAAQATRQPCHAAVLLALGQEAGGLDDRMDQLVVLRGAGFAVHLGRLEGRRLVAVISGAGRQASAHAAKAILQAHRPPMVLCAGFCGGLDPRLRRHDLFVANEVIDAQGRTIQLACDLDLAAMRLRGNVHVGRLVTVDEPIRTPTEKHALAQRLPALAVDMESFAVAEVCRAENVPCRVLRVVSDAVDDQLPREVAGLVRQKTTAARLGAALASVWNRPGSIKDLYRLKENALIASDRLAEFLAQAIGQLCPLPPAPSARG